VQVKNPLPLFFQAVLFKMPCDARIVLKWSHIGTDTSWRLFNPIFFNEGKTKVRSPKR